MMDRAPTAVQVSSTLTHIRAIESEEQAERKRKEFDFERAVRDYIINAGSEFAHGGVVNALATISMVCDELADASPDYATAAREIDNFMPTVDLRYGK